MPSEKAKMLRGELYDSMDPLLIDERKRARDLLARLNVLEYGDMDAYRMIRKELFPNAHESFWVEPPFFCDYGYNLYVGERTFFNFNSVVLDVCPVTIGSRVMFGPNVQIYGASHPMSAAERRKGLESGKPIWIGDDGWIGGGQSSVPVFALGHAA